MRLPRAGDGRERVQDVPLPLALYCRKAPIGVGYALFVLSDDQLTRIFTQPKTLCAVLSQIVCVYIYCVFVGQVRENPPGYTPLVCVRLGGST